MNFKKYILERYLRVNLLGPGRGLTKVEKHWYRRLGGPQGRFGQVRNRPNGIRSPDRPARSESLYRLSYPDPQVQDGAIFFLILSDSLHPI